MTCATQVCEIFSESKDANSSVSQPRSQGLSLPTPKGLWEMKDRGNEAVCDCSYVPQ